MNKLAEKYPKEIENILAKYPSDQKRSAVMPLLYLAQREGGYVTKDAMSEVAEIIGTSVTEVASIVGFYSLYYDKPAGKYRIQAMPTLMIFKDGQVAAQRVGALVQKKQLQDWITGAIA